MRDDDRRGYSTSYSNNNNNSSSSNSTRPSHLIPFSKRKPTEHLSPRDNNNNNNMEDGPPSPGTTRQMEYIKKLEEKNRLKKKLAASKADPKVEALEKQFNTAFNGAYKGGSRSTTSHTPREKKSSTAGIKVSRRAKSAGNTTTRKKKTDKLRPTSQPSWSSSRKKWSTKSNTMVKIAAFVETAEPSSPFENNNDSFVDPSNGKTIYAKEEEADNDDIIEEEIYSDDFFDDEDDSSSVEKPSPITITETKPVLHIKTQHHGCKEQEMMVQSPVMKLLHDCYEDKPSSNLSSILRESRTRIYCNDGDSTMEESTTTTTTTTRQLETKQRKSRHHRKAAVITSPTSIKKNSDVKSHATLLSVKDAIALENARAKKEILQKKGSSSTITNSIENKETESQQNDITTTKSLTLDAKESSHDFTISENPHQQSTDDSTDDLKEEENDPLSDTLKDLVSLVQGIPRDQQKALVQMLRSGESLSLLDSKKTTTITASVAAAEKDCKAEDQKHHVEVKNTKESSSNNSSDYSNDNAPVVLCGKEKVPPSESKDVSSTTPCWLPERAVETKEEDKVCIPKKQSRRSRRSSTTILSQEKTTPTVRTKDENQKLLESWDSIDFLSKSHNNLSSLLASTTSTNTTTKSTSSSNAKTTVIEIPKTFIVPTLPSVRTVELEILQSYGDPYYVGLNGIEFYDAFTKTVIDDITSVTSNTTSNTTSTSNDPRSNVSSLVDGVNLSSDELHSYLVPFTSGSISIKITFSTFHTLSQCRIYNYIASREHSVRGVYHARIVSIDNSLELFNGVLSGGINNNPVTVISFTTTTTNDNDDLEMTTPVEKQNKTIPPPEIHRPHTPTGKAISLNSRDIIVPSSNIPATVSEITLKLLSTWGDCQYIGLGSIEFLTAESEDVNVSSIDATPTRDLASIGSTFDPRVLENVMTSNNSTTTNDSTMWLVPFDTRHPPNVVIKFKEAIGLTGIRIWNYNKCTSTDHHTARGVRDIVIGTDTHHKKVRLRKAPGTDAFDYSQVVLLGDTDGDIKENQQRVIDLSSPKLRTMEPCAKISLPISGYVLRIVVKSTWGDLFYVGLQSLQVIDDQGLIKTPAIIKSTPSDTVSSRDIRVPMNLVISGDDTELAPEYSWLTNYNGNHVQLYVVFDTVIKLGGIKVVNYVKDPTRGVKDFDVYLDDCQIFSGQLAQYEKEQEQLIVFDKNACFGDDDNMMIMTAGRSNDSVLCINEGVAVNNGVLNENKNVAVRRPKTSVTSKKNDQHMDFPGGHPPEY